jgi:hypothetical protein
VSRAHPLGDQGLHIVRQAAQTAEQVERAAQQAARRARVEELSTRPTPGTSNILSENRPLAGDNNEHHGLDRQGKVGKIKVFDLVGAAPIHWFRPSNRKDK